MRKTINSIYHTAGAAIIVYGILLAVKAAGMADLNGDFTEIAHVCGCSIAAMACGTFLRGWKV